MADPTTKTCPNCGGADVRWLTLRKGRIPVDVLQCQKCGAGLAEDDWTAPLQPLIPGRCWNCGDRREFDTCNTCGLSRPEDVQVHDELRLMVAAPTESHLDAARHANKIGRRLLALKLATAAAGMNENGQGEVARALRIWLLAAVGEADPALQDAKAWVEHSPEPTALALASYGQQLQNASHPMAAADLYEKSLRKQPKQPNVRARRAHLLLEMGRQGQALEEVSKVLSVEGLDEPTYHLATRTAAALLDVFEAQNRDDEIKRLLDLAQGYVEGSAALLGHRARLLGASGDGAGAARDLKAARKLVPDLPIYARAEAAMKSGRGSWWKW